MENAANICNSRCPMRFGQIKKALNSIMEQMVRKQLRELEKYTPIERKDYKTVPPKVEYCLTNFGRSFTSIISQFQELGKKHKKKIIAVTEIG